MHSLAPQLYQATVPTGLDEVLVTVLSPVSPAPFQNRMQCKYTATHQPTHFNPEDGGNMYLWNVGNITHNCTV
jgi:hypothetical protein